MNSPPPDPSAELRRHDRRLLRTTATVVLAGTQTFEVRTLDISEGGAAIVAAANPKSGTVFQIRMAIPRKAKDSIPIEAEVQVMHSIFVNSEQGFRIGLRFVRIEPAAAAAITQFLK